MQLEQQINSNLVDKTDNKMAEKKPSKRQSFFTQYPIFLDIKCTIT